MLFSLRRKAPKDSLRLPPQTPIHLLESACTRLERCCSARGARTGHHSPCEKQVRLGNPRPQAQSCRSALAVRSACSAVDCVPLRYANTCREPTECAIGLHKRSNGTFAASFRSFLSAKKRTRFSFAKGERYVLFSLRRKAPKDSPRRCLGLSSCYWETHTHGSQQLFALASLGKPTFAVRRLCATGKPAPTGTRRAPRERPPARYSK